MARNKLLSLLSHETSNIVHQALEPVDLHSGQVLYEPDRPIRFVYFHNDGLSSEMIIDQQGEKIEVGCIGLEGLSGVPVVQGVASSPHRAIMELGGRALRIRSPELQELMDENAELRQVLLKYVHVFMAQLASTALVDSRYSVQQRLTRWLLMAHDRIVSDELPLTHDLFALKLGVRRSSVTNAIHLLEGDGLVKSTRGLITIMDRAGLEAAAGGAYGFAEAEYRRVLLESLSPADRRQHRSVLWPTLNPGAAQPETE